jgi:hypothetical protein
LPELRLPGRVGRLPGEVAWIVRDGSVVQALWLVGMPWRRQTLKRLEVEKLEIEKLETERLRVWTLLYL